MNNVMLAQLMKDMQDPQMMAEARAMMQSPEFQAQMKKMTENPSFKKAMEQTKKVLEDPEKVKELESKLKVALEDGSKKLEEIEATKKTPATTDGEEADADELDVPNLQIN